MIRVFHDKEMGLNHNYFGKNDPKVEDLVLTAEVDTEDLEKAFELTNHIDANWWENEGVTHHKGSRRSTSCGDVMELKGNYFVVASAGFRELPNKDYYAQLLSYDSGYASQVQGSIKEPESLVAASSGFVIDNFVIDNL